MSFPNSHFCKKLVLNCFVQHTIICLSVNFFSNFFFMLTFLTNCPAVVNAIIIVFYSFKIFLTSLPSCRLCQNFGLISAWFQDINRCFSLQILLKKQITSIEQCVLHILLFVHPGMSWNSHENDFLF